jgi:hypothetical protein
VLQYSLYATIAATAERTVVGQKHTTAAFQLDELRVRVMTYLVLCTVMLCIVHDINSQLQVTAAVTVLRVQHCSSYKVKQQQERRYYHNR